MIFSGAYSAASETADVYVSSVLDILRKKEKVEEEKEVKPVIREVSLSS